MVLKGSTGLFSVLQTGFSAIQPFVLIVGCLSFLSLLFTAWAINRSKFKKSLNSVMQLNHTLMLNDKQLREDRKTLYALISSINDIIFEFDENKICLNVWHNGFTPGKVNTSQFIGKRLAEVLGPRKAAQFDVKLDEVIKHKKPVYIEFPSVFDSGRWFIARLTAVIDDKGNFTGRIAGAVSDISEQKKYETALQENQTLLTEAQNIARLGNWWYDTQTKENYWSKNIYSLLEIDDVPNGQTKIDYYMSLVHPDDRTATYLYFYNIQAGEPTPFEHRLITTKGTLKYIKVINGRPVFDKNGEVKRIIGVLQDITETKLAERTIKKNRAELLEAQTIAKIGNWKWNANTRSLSWSDEVFRIFETTEKPRSASGYFKLLLKYAHPNDRTILANLIKEALSIGRLSHEYRIITPKGKLKYVSIILGKIMRDDNGLPRKIVGTLQDITDRKQVETDYKQSESKYRRVLENIKLAAITVDDKGNVIFCNKYLAELVGYEQHEVLGKNWLHDFIPENIRPVFEGWFADKKIELNYVNPIICRNGEERLISWQNTVVYDDQGNIKETSSIGEDITDQQKATLELISAKELAEKSSEFKSEFLSIMSHEIRTPMNAVIGTTNLLIAEDPKPEQLEYLNILKFSGENLLAIINDILEYNRIEAGKLELHDAPFDIDELLQKIKQSFYQKAIEKGLQLNVVEDMAVTGNLIGDSVRVSQILNNLISNGIKFTHNGHVTVILKKELVENDKVAVHFTVSDTGIGIAPENLNRIFDPFIQETQYNHNHYGGSGLGLAITKRLVEMHGSNIFVESQPDKGTTFRFTLKFDQHHLNKSEIQKAPFAGKVKGMRVLVVDDNRMNIMIASKFLKKWDAEVFHATDGQEAVDKSHTSDFDLIIMDLQMPVMDGFEATRVIKKSKPHLNIIALTADAMPETFNKALKAGMDGYLTKPFVPEQLFWHGA